MCPLLETFTIINVSKFPRPCPAGGTPSSTADTPPAAALQQVQDRVDHLPQQRRPRTPRVAGSFGSSGFLSL